MKQLDSITIYSAMHLKSEKNDYHLVREDGQQAFNLVHFLSPVIVVVDGLELNAERNSCIIYQPGTRQEYKASPDGMVNNFITFNAENDKIVRLYGLPLDELFLIENETPITELFEYISWALADFNADHADDLREHFYLLLRTISEHQILNHPQAQRAYQTKKRFFEMREEVRKNPKGWTVAKMAQNVYLTRSRFSVLYHDFFKITPSDDLITMTFEYGKRLLLETSETIAEIAHTCGYQSVEHFIRLFSKREGVTPGQYRKKSMKANESE